MPLMVKEWSDPLRPTPKGGDVKKCGDVDRSTQKVGTTNGFRKRWGRCPNVGTSGKQKMWGRRLDSGDVPTFSLGPSSATPTERGTGV